MRWRGGNEQRADAVLSPLFEEQFGISEEYRIPLLRCIARERTTRYFGGHRSNEKRNTGFHHEQHARHINADNRFGVCF
jgi:hypothetical protein